MVGIFWEISLALVSLGRGVEMGEGVGVGEGIGAAVGTGVDEEIGKLGQLGYPVNGWAAVLQICIS